jgi:hypothetical protein
MDSAQRKTLASAAIGGILAGLGCGSSPLPVSVPGAPLADPEGSIPATASTGGVASPPSAEKHACGANGCKASMKKGEPNPSKP